MNKMSEEYVRLQNVNKINFYDEDSSTIYFEGVSTGGVSGVSMSTSLMVSGEYMNFGNSMGTTGYGFHNSSGTVQFKHSGGDWANISGASVAGSDTQIQFNNSGSFGADSNFTFDSTGKNFAVGDSQTITGSDSAIAGGVSNQAYADMAFVAGGFNNSASGASSAVIGGASNSVSGEYSGNIAGYGNTVSGTTAGNIAGYQNTASGQDSGNIAGYQNTASGQDSGNIAGYQNTASGNQSGNLAGGSNTVSGAAAGNVAGANNTVDGAYTGNVAGQNNGVSGWYSGNLAGQNNTIFDDRVATLGGQGLSTQGGTGTSWDNSVIAGRYNDYSSYPWDKSVTQTLPGASHRFVIGGGSADGSRNNAFSVDDVGNIYFGSQAGASIYQRTGANTYAPLTSVAGGGGTVAGSDTQIQFNNSGSFGADSNFTFDSTGKNFAVGDSQTITGSDSAIAGGVSNQAYANMAFVAGGFNNSASGVSSAVVGGFDNSATGSASGNVAGKNNTVSGIESGNLAGEDNIVSGTESGNLAGEQNTVSGMNSGNVSGENNTVSGNHSGNLAGTSNTVSGDRSGNLAGTSNTVSGDRSGNLAGTSNTIATGADYSAIAGGVSNQVYADMAFVAGGFNNSASGASSAVVGGYNNRVISTYSGNLAGFSNNVSGSYSGNVAGQSNEVSDGYCGNLAGHSNTVGGLNSGNLAGFSNNVSGSYSGNVAGKNNTNFDDQVATLGGQGLSTQGGTGTSWDNSAITGRYNDYSSYPWDKSGSQTLPGASHRFVIGGGSAPGSRNNAFSVDDVGNVYFGSQAGASIYQRTGTSTYAPLATGIASLAEDTTPQLGGDLDVNGKDIVSASNGDIDLAPDGTGKVVFRGVTGNGGNGAGRFKLNCENNSHGIILQGPPHSAAADYTLTLPNDDGTADQVLKTDGSGVLSWVAQSGGGGGTVAGSDTDVQFNDGGSFGADGAFQFHKSTASGVSALSIDGNVFSNMGVSDSQSDTPGTHQITAEEFVNGFVFPPYYSVDEGQLFVVKVPTFTQIQTSYPAAVLREGQTFDTVIYGTSIGSSPAIGMSFPSDITILENTGTIFDRRLASDKTISGGLSFHFADAGLDYYQSVVIRSRMGSAGVSMYPYATSFYTC